MTDTDQVVLLDDDGRAIGTAPEEQRPRHADSAPSRILVPCPQRRRTGARDTPGTRQERPGRASGAIRSADTPSRPSRCSPPSTAAPSTSSGSPSPTSSSPCRSSATARRMRTASSSTRCAPSTRPAPPKSPCSIRSRWSTRSGSIPPTSRCRSSTTPWAFSPWLVLQAEQLHLFDDVHRHRRAS